MTVNRRDFVTSVVLTAVAPTVNLLSAPSPTLATGIDYPVAMPAMMMVGWSISEETNPNAAVWIRVDRSWRTAWR